jgi:NADPH:quinone reductase-like Zn-dependent oxidoreductase
MIAWRVIPVVGADRRCSPRAPGPCSAQRVAVVDAVSAGARFAQCLLAASQPALDGGKASAGGLGDLLVAEAVGVEQQLAALAPVQGQEHLAHDGVVDAVGDLDDLARKPAGLSWEQAAGLPVAAETSVRVFKVLGGVGAGQTLLINGAAGGVGAVAVQMAVARGARVVGTASERNHDFLRTLGAEPTTYGPGLVERVSALAPDGVDLAFDTAGQGGVPDLITLTGDPARVATIADFGAAALGVKVTGGADGRAVEALGEAAELNEAGRLQLPVEQIFTFADAAEAHRVSQDGHVRGKLILVPG